MRIPHEALTPALQAALQAYFDDAQSLRETLPTGAPSSPDRARALLTKHTELKSWTGFAVFACIFSSFLIGMFLLAGESPWLLLIPGLLIAGTVAFTNWLRSNRPDGVEPTVAYMEAVLPSLALVPVQRRYAEALVAVTSGGAKDPGGDGVALLRRLADEEERLLTLAARVGSSNREDAFAEAQTVRDRLATTGDPAARAALEQSLALAESRAASRESTDGVRERLEAHRILLDNASRTAAEGILGRGDLHGWDTLRANVASLSSEAAALEAAVSEMRSLSS